MTAEGGVSVTILRHGPVELPASCSRYIAATSLTPFLVPVADLAVARTRPTDEISKRVTYRA